MAKPKQHKQPDQCDAELRFLYPGFLTEPVGSLFLCSCGAIYEHHGQGRWLSTRDTGKATE